jgi:glycosyltransferase involved in cell wall biosynthesis
MKGNALSDGQAPRIEAVRKPKKGARVLLISSTFPPVTGGSAIVYENICRFSGGAVVALAASRDYLTGTVFAGLEAHDRQSGYPVYRLPLLRPLNATRQPGLFPALRSGLDDVGLMLRLLLRSVWVARREGIQVICLGDLVYGGWLVFPLKYLFRYKVIFYVHGEEVTVQSGGGLFDRWRARFLAHADAVVSVSRFTREVLTRLMQVDPAKITLVPNGVNLERFQPRTIPAGFAAHHGVEGKRVLLSVGRLVARKGADRLIEAMPQVVRACPDVHLLIAGDGPMRSKLEGLIQSLNLQRSVTLLGAVSDRDLDDLYALAEVFALPNREMPDGDTEGFGLVFLEANACGKPVIAGMAGGAPDAVTDQINGLTVDGNSVDAVADAVNALFTDKDLYERLSQGALMIARRSGWESRAANFLSLCGQLAGPAPARTDGARAQAERQP